MTDRDAIQLILDSEEFEEFERRKPTDGFKVRSEFAGVRKTMASSRFGKGLQALCRLHPPDVAVPPTPSATLLAQPGALLRAPSGHIEDMARFRAAGGRWVAANVGDHSLMEWQQQRYKAQQAGVKFGYWMRCRTAQDVRNLFAWSIGMELALVNIEQPEVEQAGFIEAVAHEMSLYTPGAATGTVLQGWVGFVGQDGKHYGPDYSPLAPWPALLEVFPTDMHIKPYAAWSECREHALGLGLKTVYQLVQCYDGASPSWYTAPYSLYCLDDCANEIEAWL